MRIAPPAMNHRSVAASISLRWSAQFSYLYTDGRAVWNNTKSSFGMDHASKNLNGHKTPCFGGLLCTWSRSFSISSAFQLNHSIYVTNHNSVVTLSPLVWPTNSWDLLASLRHPCKFQRVSCLGSDTARHSISGRQPNFAALNSGRHWYSTGRPSHWALAHISSFCSKGR